METLFFDAEKPFSAGTIIVLFDGLLIHPTPSGTEVYLTPDINIETILSSRSITSSTLGDTGAPVVKHLRTFSIEEVLVEEHSLMECSMCSTSEEDATIFFQESRGSVENTEDFELNQYSRLPTDPLIPGSRYRRPLDSLLETPTSTHCEETVPMVASPSQLKNQRDPHRPVLRVVTSNQAVYPHSDKRFRTEPREQQWPDENLGKNNLSPNNVQKLDHSTSPRPFANLCPNSPLGERNRGVKCLEKQN